MDIDSLSIDERNKLMKEGKCFICRQTGHMAKDHKKNDFTQKREDAPKYKRVETPKKNWEGNALYAHVRSMIAELDTEEKEKFTYRHYTVPDHPIQGTNTVYRTIRVHGAPRIRECDTKLGRMHYRYLLALLYPPGGFGRCRG